MALCFRRHDWGAAIEGLRRLAEGVCARAGYAPSGRAVKRNLAAVRTPRFFQIVTCGIPVRYYGNIIRGIFLSGSGMGVLWSDALTLFGIGILVLTLASLRLRRTSTEPWSRSRGWRLWVGARARPLARERAWRL